MNIGIIGGADGPTAIFITSALGNYIIVGIAAVCTAAIIIYLFIKKNRR